MEKKGHSQYVKRTQRDVNKSNMGVGFRGRGAKPNRTRKQEWGKGCGRRVKRKKGDVETASWPHAPSTTEGAQLSLGSSEDTRGFGVSTCLLNPNLNRPPTQQAVRPPPIMPGLCHSTDSVLRSLLAPLLPPYSLQSPVHQHIKHKVYHELSCGAGSWRLL